jgi:hypothetical protein
VKIAGSPGGLWSIDLKSVESRVLLPAWKEGSKARPPANLVIIFQTIVGQRQSNTLKEPVSMNAQTRRSFIAGIGAAKFASATSAGAQSSAGSALPLKNLGLEHLDIAVPDTAISAKFYMQV